MSFVIASPGCLDPSSTIGSLAATVSQSAADLERLLAACKLAPPTFSARPGSRRTWKDAETHPEVLDARSRLIDAAQALVDLALGPSDVLASYVGDRISEIDVLRTMEQLGVAEAVPLPHASDGLDGEPETGISVAELADKLGVRHIKAFESQLRFAYLMGFLRPTGDGRVAHTGLSAAMADEKPWVAFRLGRVMCGGAHEIAGALRHGPSPAHPADPEAVPAARADPAGRGRAAFAQLRDEPDGLGMHRYSISQPALYNHHAGHSFHPLRVGLPWHALAPDATVVDVGGGNAHFEEHLLPLVGPDATFIVEDHVSNRASAEATIASKGMAPRVTFLEHDFFTPQPEQLPGGRIPSVYLLFRILQDWDAASAIRILRGLVPSMRKHGARLWIMNRLLPDDMATMPRFRERMQRNLDLIAYTCSGGGERSEGEMRRLLEAADLELVIDRTVRPPNCLFSFVEVSVKRRDGAALKL